MASVGYRLWVPRKTRGGSVTQMHQGSAQGSDIFFSRVIVFMQTHKTQLPSCAIVGEVVRLPAGVS